MKISVILRLLFKHVWAQKLTTSSSNKVRNNPALESNGDMTESHVVRERPGADHGDAQEGHVGNGSPGELRQVERQVLTL